MALLWNIFMPLAVRAQSEERAVTAAVQRLFDAMARRDAAAARKLMLPEGRLFSVHQETSEVRAGPTNLQWAEALADGNGRYLERMWNPKVMIHGRIAVLWAKYDFHLNGRFSHCGVDSIDLVKTSEGWKIAGGLYTVERKGCSPSPLGPP